MKNIYHGGAVAISIRFIYNNRNMYMYTCRLYGCIKIKSLEIVMCKVSINKY